MRALVDTVRRVETPEGVELLLRPAGPVPRALAQAVDAAILVSGLLAGAGALAAMGALGGGLAAILSFLGFWLYPVVFEVLWKGQTPGKRMVGLRVLTREGRPVDLGASLLRNVVRVMDLLPGFYFVGLVSILCTEDAQRLGDLVAGTLVVHADTRPPVLRLPEAAPVAPPHPLDGEEQAALTSFAERSPRLTAARSRELSDLLEPLSGARGDEGLARILGMARHAWGGK